MINQSRPWSKQITFDFDITVAATDSDGNPYPLLLVPRSSISNSPFRLSNSIGLIDMGYRGTCFKYVTDILKKTMIISEKIKSKFIIQPMRWVVERTFSWLNEYRRLAKDFEYSISSEKNFIMIAHSIMLLRRD
jgi:transposase